jgi:Tfp pilus assembly protein PilZ
VTDERADNLDSSPDDRRQHDRSRLIVDVFFDGKDATGVASTKDIGAGGLYLNTQAELAEGSVLLLRIPIGQKQIVVNAEVVYSNPGRGVGVRFQELSEEYQNLIERGLDR